MSARNTLTETKAYDVVIVGAGLSGLTAANQLLSLCPEMRVLVLEAKDRVGGRTQTVDMKSPKGSDKYDMGGQWVSNSQPHIMNLLSALSIDTYPQYLTGKKFMQLKDKIATYTGSIPSLPILSLLDLQLFIYRFDRLCLQIDISDPYNHPRAEEFDAMTIETYKNKVLYTEATKTVLGVALRTTFGFEASSLSLLYVLTYARSAGGLMKLFEATHGSAQEKRIEGGAMQISQKLVNLIGTEKILLSSPVTEIVQITCSDTDCYVEVYLKNKDMVHAKYIIMAIPPHLALDITFSPPLSDEAKSVLASARVGHLTKYIATYPKAFWRDQGFSGEVVSAGGPSTVEGCDTGPIGVVYDATTHHGSPALVGFLGGEQGTQWCRKPFEVRKRSILEGLSKFFGEQALKPLEFNEKIWSNEPYNGGCPITAPAPEFMRPWTFYFKIPWGRIHWAGTEMATAWSGYMSGAVQAGTKAANDVLREINPPGLREEYLEDKFVVKSLPRRDGTRNVAYGLAAFAFGALAFFYVFRVTK